MDLEFDRACLTAQNHPHFLETLHIEHKLANKLVLT